MLAMMTMIAMMAMMAIIAMLPVKSIMLPSGKERVYWTGLVDNGDAGGEGDASVSLLNSWAAATPPPRQGGAHVFISPERIRGRPVGDACSRAQ